MREAGDGGVKATAARFQERASASARHDGTRLAHARWRLTRAIGWELGSPGFQLAAYRRKPVHGAASCRSVSDPKRAVPGGMTRDARGRDRPSEAPPAMWRGGSASAPGSEAARQRDRTCASGSAATRVAPRHDASGSRSAEADAPHRASPRSGSSSANCVDPCVEPLTERRRCLTT